MTNIAMRFKVGLAACAVAASASLVPIAPAEAAPVPAPASPVLLVPAPATPVLFGPSDVPLTGWWWKSGHTDLLGLFKPIHKIGFIFRGLFNCWGGYGHHNF